MSIKDIDSKDRAILNRIQSNFPVSKRPFLTIAQDLGLDEETVIKKINALKKRGIIRRIGGNFVPEKLGFVSTLCAAKVPSEMLKDFADAVNSFSGVTHNYIRQDSQFNVWFTFIAPSMEQIEKNLKHISEKTGISEIINLPASKVFKIKAHFDL